MSRSMQRRLLSPWWITFAYDRFISSLSSPSLVCRSLIISVWQSDGFDEQAAPADRAHSTAAKTQRNAARNPPRSCFQVPRALCSLQ